LLEYGEIKGFTLVVVAPELGSRGGPHHTEAYCTSRSPA
jgi:hypothetical protein